MTDRMIMGERANLDESQATDDIAANSSTSRRLDELRPGWRQEFRVVNVWRHRDDQADAASRIEQILAADRPRVVVALGRRVNAALGVPAITPWLSSFLRPDDVLVVKMPHPSGLNRWWNDPANASRAAVAMEAAATV